MSDEVAHEVEHLLGFMAEFVYEHHIQQSFWEMHCHTPRRNKFSQDDFKATIQLV